MSTVKADNFTWKTGQATGQSGTNVTGDQIVYGVAKSWFNGSMSTSTVRASYNISSTTFNGTGDATASFSVAHRMTAYSVTYGVDSGSVWFAGNYGYASYNLTTSLRIYGYSTSASVNVSSIQFTVTV